jgi:hypothetical protein
MIHGAARAHTGPVRANGTAVDLRPDATAGRTSGTLRLRLSNGYDSGTFAALEVHITP